MQYETVIGLEIHVELATETKLFCSCAADFGSAPNTQCCPVCLGLPGSLPVLNKKALEYAIMTGLALNCKIRNFSKFDRKNYFYPDLPRGYQISQLYMPLCYEGHIDIDVKEGKKTIGIWNIHLEDDAGKLIHDPAGGSSLADYNRSGVPLIEIVSAPDMSAPEEAVEFLVKLRNILRFIGVSDCKMQEGSFRADINLSVRPAGSKVLGTRTEMKNLNSFKAIARAIEAESCRQIELLKEGKQIVQETRRWDEARGISMAMRSKEELQDYRYFSEPDLLPIEIDDSWINEIKSKMPMLPDEKKRYYISHYGLPKYDTDIIVSDKKLADIFEETTKLCGKPKEVSNWIMGDLLKLLKEKSLDPGEVDFSPAHLAKLINLIDNNVINRSTARQIFEEIFTNNTDPEKYIHQHGLCMISDESSIRKIIQQVLDANPCAVNDYKTGKNKAFGFLVGQVMKELKGKADPGTVNDLLKSSLQ